MTNSIRTVFWEVGGVVLTEAWGPQQRTRVLGRLGVDLQAYEEAHAQTFSYWQRGLMSAEDFFRQTVLQPNPHLDLTFESLWKQVCAESRVLHPECLDMLAEMRVAGRWRVATFANESRELHAYRVGNFKLRKLFDYFLCSGSLHEQKPSPAIYRAVIDISGYPPERSLLIDSSQANCDAAAAMGMETIHFHSPETLREELAAREIVFGAELELEAR